MEREVRILNERWKMRIVITSFSTIDLLFSFSVIMLKSEPFDLDLEIYCKRERFWATCTSSFGSPHLPWNLIQLTTIIAILHKCNFIFKRHIVWSKFNLTIQSNRFIFLVIFKTRSSHTWDKVHVAQDPLLYDIFEIQHNGSWSLFLCIIVSFSIDFESCWSLKSELVFCNRNFVCLLKRNVITVYVHCYFSLCYEWKIILI